MTFQVQHTWTGGSIVNGASLSSCSHCGTLRVFYIPRSGPLFIKVPARADDDHDRIFNAEPTCFQHPRAAPRGQRATVGTAATRRALAAEANEAERRERGLSWPPGLDPIDPREGSR